MSGSKRDKCICDRLRRSSIIIRYEARISPRCGWPAILSMPRWHRHRTLVGRRRWSRRPLTLTPADLKTMPADHGDVREEGKEIRYEGVLVGELLSVPEHPSAVPIGKAVAIRTCERAPRRLSGVFCSRSWIPASRRTHLSPTTNSTEACSTTRARCVIVAPHRQARRPLDPHAQRIEASFW